ncbi:response regulator transcription factor [Thermodesulfobacteriota bacterium]
MKRVLVIDDEKDFNYFIKYNLQFINPDFRVLTASAGKAGIRKAIREKPDIILLDIMMPKMNGYEVLKKLKKSEKTLSIPVVMLSAKCDEESMIEASGLFCEDYMTKPINLNELRAKIDEVLSRFD